MIFSDKWFKKNRSGKEAKGEKCRNVVNDDTLIREASNGEKID